MDEGKAGLPVFFAFGLLFLDGEGTAGRLGLSIRQSYSLFRKEIPGLRYSEHVAGHGPQFRAPGWIKQMEKQADGK